MQMRTNRGFTLSEVMIALTIIGILTAILLPVAKNSVPDEELMKFKNTHFALMNGIRELVNNGQYYLDGDLSLKPDGSTPDCCYHAHALADVLNAQVVSCDENKYSAGICYNTDELINEFKNKNSCETYAEYLHYCVAKHICINQIKLTNNMNILYSPPNDDTGCLSQNGLNAKYGNILIGKEFNFDYNKDGKVSLKDIVRLQQICAGTTEGDIPVVKASYLIRKDGRIIQSNAVSELLEKSILEKD